MRFLITGGTGFVGRHLAQYLRTTQPEAELHLTSLFAPESPLPERCIVHSIDLRDYAAVELLLDSVQPHAIIHLAAQSSPARSFVAPWETLEVNIQAQLNVLQGCVSLKIMPRILVVSSAEIYGPVTPEHLPITEETALCPSSPYGVSKITQDMLGLQYFVSHGLPIVRVRPFNHTGPGQSAGFVAIDFAMQIARIEAGQQQPAINVGNLEAQRDFTDVRDMVRAYALLLEHGTPGEVYLVASGKPVSIQWLLNTLLSYSRTPIEVCIDPARFRPIEIPVLYGDASRLHQAVGWSPEIPFQQTLLDVLNDCRKRV